MLKNLFTNKKLIYISIIILCIGVVSIIIYVLTRPDKDKSTSTNLSTIEKGLEPIKIWHKTKDGQEQEVNFTKIGAEILASSLISDKPLIEEIQNNTQDIGISRIELPLLPEENINVLSLEKLNKNSIDNYLTNLYNIFRENSIQPNINQLTEDALNSRTQDIQNLLNKNKDLYYSLFIIEVPPDALQLHKAYIRIAQVQNGFLLGLLDASSDPLKLDINNKLTISILKTLDTTIKQELQTLRQKYNLIYQKP
jgi:hypothetical protein